MTETTILYPNPGVTLFLPGGGHGFRGGSGIGVPVPAAHAGPMLAVGHVKTEAQLLAEAQAEKAAAAEKTAGDALAAAKAAEQAVAPAT